MAILANNSLDLHPALEKEGYKVVDAMD